jgi:hypothetical protein
MSLEKYKGFRINVAVSKLKDDMGWGSTFDIEKHEGDFVTSTPFCILATFKSEGNAVDSALARGRYLIDTGFAVKF